MDNNSIVINKKVIEKTKIVEVLGDVIVPDIKPDIINIIDTNGNAYIYKEEVTLGRIRVDGNIDTYIVYLSENGETRCMQTTINFIESIEDNNISVDMISKSKVILQNIETKILNERKITIKAILKIKTEFFEKNEIEILDKLQEVQGVEKLKESFNIKSLVGINKSKTSIREDISVDSSLEIAEILRTNIEITNLENKITYNKVLAKADANIKIIFLTENEQISKVETTIPIMSFIDLDKVKEENSCNIEYNIRNMLIKANSKEMHSINCQVDFEVWCEAYEIKNIEIIQDMYGIKEEITFNKKQSEVQIAEEDRIENVKINERIMLEDVHSIFDTDCIIKIINTTTNGNYTNYEGELNLNFYYEADNKNGLNVKNVRIPFLTKFETLEKEIEMKVVSKKFSISNENVDCEIELQVDFNNRNMKKINIIENVERKCCEQEKDYKMCIYFVKAGDTIWKIAKKFKVCMEDIIRINNLDNQDKLSIGDRLYIMR